jgi:hypothetical protein
MTAMMTIICLTEMFRQIDKSFIKLKEERTQNIGKIQALEKEIEIEKFKNDKNIHNEEITTPSIGMPKSEEINKILVNENKKLHVRCDMLEEELRKTREQSSTSHLYK